MAEKQQDIHIGMKMTEAGWVPEDWDVKLVCSLCKVHGRIGFRGYTSADLVKVGEGALTIGGKNITHCTLDLSDADYISWKKYYESPEIMVKKGDIVMAQRGTLGKAAFIDKEIGPVTINPSLVLLNSIKCNKQYLFYYLISEPVVFSILSLTGLTSIPMISQRQIENIPIYLPIYPAEQHRIAQVLGDIDALIASLSRTIEKKRLIKQGAMQQLLTGKTRLKGFKGEWVEKELGDVCRIQRGAILKSSDYCYGSIPVIAGGKTPAGFHDVANREGRTITISASGANAGYVSFHNGKIFASDCSTISESKDYNIDFIYQFLLMNQLEIYRAQTGGAQPHIHPKDIAPMKIKIPNYVEQFAISEHLRTMDNEIESLEIELQKYKALKQGMMQKLLTGQIRLSYGKES